MEDPRSIYLSYALCDSIEDENLSHIRHLLKNEKANPNTLLPEKDYTPLHYAVGFESLLFAEEVTKLFLQHGGNPNVRNSDGLTPVHVAASWGHADILRLLLVNGGDPWIKDNETCTAFHYAVQESHWNVVEVLKFHMKDISLQQATNSSVQNPKYEVNLERVILSNGDIILECAVSSDIPETESEFNNAILLSSSHYSDLYMGCSSVDNLELFSNEKLKRRLQKSGSGVRSSGCSNLFFSDSSISNKEASRVIECITLSSSETSDNNYYSNERKIVSSDQNSDVSPVFSQTCNQKSPTEKCVSFEYIQSSSVLSTKSFTQRRSTKSRRQLLPRFSMNVDSSVTNCDLNSSFMTFDQREHSANQSVEHVTGNTLLSVICSLEKLSVDSSSDGIHALGSSHSMPSLQVCSRSVSCNSVLNDGFSGEDTHSYMNHTPSDPLQVSPGKYDRHSVACKMFQSTPKKDCKIVTSCGSDKPNTEGQMKVKPNKKSELVVITDSDYTSSDNLHVSPAKYDRDSVACRMFQSTPKKDCKIGTSREKDKPGTEKKSKLNPNKKSALVVTIESECDFSARGVRNESSKSLQKVVSEETSPKFDLYNICQERKSDSGQSSKISDYVNFFTCSSNSSSGGSYFSVTEEYKYSDEEIGIVLKERRILTEKYSVPDGVFDNVKIPADGCINVSSPDSLSASSTVSSLKLNLDYDTESLRAELRDRNCIPGPITKTTKRLYLKKLIKLKKPGRLCNQEQKSPEYSPELECTLKNMEWVNGLAACVKLEQEVATQFSNINCERRWRGGITKSAFCYLLLDPRVSKNLPCRTQTLQPLQIWQTFLSSIFYIGKGVRNRPYSHLYQAASLWKTKSNSKDKKVQHILDIWNEGLGVVCLHVFQNVIPVEAHTREAAMIEAMGLKALKNARHSEYYGVAATWNSKQKRKLGIYLLYRALLIFLSEGERQLGPENL